MTAFAVYLVPALAGLAIVLSAWTHARSRDHQRPVALLWTALVVSCGVAAAVFLGRAPGVSGVRALEGAAISSIACLLLACAYYLAGRHIKPLAGVVVFWLVSLVPYYWFVLTVVIVVAAFSQCPPGSYECPV